MSAASAAYAHVLDFRWRQGDPSISEAEGRLHDLRALQTALSGVVALTVADARADDLSWAQIGDALGVSAQAAAARYGQRRNER